MAVAEVIAKTRRKKQLQLVWTRFRGKTIDAMAVIFMVMTLVWLLIALRFVNPTQIVAGAKQPTTA